MRKWFAYGGIAASVILMAFGAGAIGIGVNGYNEVRDSIAAQNITATPDAGRSPTGNSFPVRQSRRAPTRRHSQASLSTTLSRRRRASSTQKWAAS